MKQPIKKTAAPVTDEEMEKVAAYQQLQREFLVSNAVMAPMVAATFNSLQDMMQAWFTDVQGFNRQNFDGDAMLIVTELAEMVEADRTNSMSDKIPEFHGREEELADALVRVFHLAAKYNLRLAEAFTAKMAMNLTRPYKHGKKY